ncbi:MAG: UPF0147 family protein [Halobacteria archaeon]|nr:UPF0147 family protein [Halobacteria archaeon]
MTDEEKINQAVDELDRVIDDDSVPQNIRESLEEAKEHLLDESQEPTERAANSINVLNDVSDDPNLPMHTRTKIWNISGELETVTME